MKVEELFEWMGTNKTPIHINVNTESEYEATFDVDGVPYKFQSLEAGDDNAPEGNTWHIMFSKEGDYDKNIRPNFATSVFSAVTQCTLDFVAAHPECKQITFRVNKYNMGLQGVYNRLLGIIPGWSGSIVGTNGMMVTYRFEKRQFGGR